MRDSATVATAALAARSAGRGSLPVASAIARAGEDFGFEPVLQHRPDNDAALSRWRVWADSYTAKEKNGPE